MRRAAVACIAAASVSLCRAAPDFVSLRFAVSTAPFHSGATYDSCFSEPAARTAAACTAGVADAELAVRLAAHDVPARVPPGAPDSPSSAAERVNITRTEFLPVVSESAAFSEMDDNWTVWCDVLQALETPLALPSVKLLKTAKTFECDVPLEELTNVSSFPTGMSADQFQRVSLTADGLLVIRSVVARFDPDTFVVTTRNTTDDFLKSGAHPHGAVVMVACTDAATQLALAEALAAESPLVKALICEDDVGSVEPVRAPGGVWMVRLRGPGAATDAALFDLTVPLAAGGNQTAFELHRATLHAYAPVAVRSTDSRWLAAQEAAGRYFLLRRSLDPAFGRIAVALDAPGKCRTEDCPFGQFLAEVHAWAPAPKVDAADTTAEDPRKLAAEPADVSIVPMIFGNWAAFRVGDVRTSFLEKAYVWRWTCRGHLRGLTILRLLQKAVGQRGLPLFGQYFGVRLAYVPMDKEADRSQAVIVSAEVFNRTTGRYEPLERTKLYSAAFPSFYPSKVIVSSIFGRPLTGDGVPCEASRIANLPALLGRMVERLSPVNYTVTPRATILDADSPEAVAAGADGLITTESARLCAERNGAAVAAGNLFFDADLDSCMPCPSHLVANAAADSCVAPPPPPPPPDHSALIIGSAVGGAMLLMVACAAVAALLVPRWRRRHCPVDDALPFTVAYVSTLNEGALRERHPDGTGKALRLVERVVAREAAAAGCVVAQRLEAHHMIVARDPARALLCAAAVLRTLHATDWAPVLATAADEERHHRIHPARPQRSGTTVGTPTETARSSEMRGTKTGSAAESGDTVVPCVAAGLWHGHGTIEHDETGGEAFGFRYSGAVAQCAAAAAMRSPPWQVSMGSAARASAEEALWAATGGPPQDLCDDDVLAELGISLSVMEDRWEDSDASPAESHAQSSGCQPDDAAAPRGPRLAPPQVGRGAFVPRGTAIGISPAVLLQAGAASPALECLDLLLDSGGDGDEGAYSDHQLPLSCRSGARGKRCRAESAAVAGGLAAALSAASGRLAVQRIGVICVYVPALRALLPSVSAAAVHRLFASRAAAEASPAADDIVSAALGAAAHSRLVSMLDGCLYFALNAPDVTTAQVPARAAQDALAITKAVADSTGALVAAGVAAGPALVGSGQHTLGEREGSLKARPGPIAVLGTASERARLLAFVGFADAEDLQHGRPFGMEGESPESKPAMTPKSAVSPMISAASISATGTARDGDVAGPAAAPPVMVAGDLAAELSAFELQVTDVVAWPRSVASLAPPQRAGMQALVAADMRRRVAAAVRVVADTSESESVAVAAGEGEWLYLVGAVGGTSQYAAANAAAGAVLRPLGVAVDFIPSCAATDDTDVELPFAIRELWGEVADADEDGCSAFAKGLQYASHRSVLATYGVVGSAPLPKQTC